MQGLWIGDRQGLPEQRWVTGDQHERHLPWVMLCLYSQRGCWMDANIIFGEDNFTVDRLLSTWPHLSRIIAQIRSRASQKARKSYACHDGRTSLTATTSHVSDSRIPGIVDPIPTPVSEISRENRWCLKMHTIPSSCSETRKVNHLLSPENLFWSSRF